MLFLSLRSTAVLLVFCLVLQAVSAGYVVTFPRKWVSGARTQICLALDSPPGPNDGVTLEVVDQDEDLDGNIGFPGPGGGLLGALLGRRAVGGELKADFRGESRRLVALRPIFGIPFEFDEVSLLSCKDFEVPDGLATNEYGGSYIAARVTGSVGGVNISEVVPVVVIKPIAKIILQTDKTIYKAGQIVQFRVLTLKGVHLDVSTEPYPEIFVESPSGSRIAQWLDVPNPSGLIHRELQLNDEPEEGTYRIVVRGSASTPEATEYFKVEDYVLPRFEVTVTPPPYFLATDEFLKLKVCAQYTFGQPVRGNVSVNIVRPYYYYYGDIEEVNYREELVGCDTFYIPVSPLNINNPSSYWWSLQVTVVVEEEDTGVETNEELYISIDRTVLRFSRIDEMKFIKPNLPFPYSIVVQFPNHETAPYEPMTACYEGECRNFTTDGFGVLRVVCPPLSSGERISLEVQSVNYPDVSYNSSVYPYMYWSRGSFYAQAYYSPSNSSLLIIKDAPYFTCTYGASITIQLPVLYAAQGVTQAILYVQVVSRGQIQYWKSYEVQFTPTDLPFDESDLLSPIEAPVSSSTIRGAFNLILELPPTVSSTAHVLIWYTRPDGEVVSDEQELLIEPCLKYSVELSWSAESAEQGTELPLTLTAEPNSLCSLGVVDKSVELLSGPQISLLTEVFQLIDEANVQYWEASQVNDYEYCMSTIEEPEPVLPPLGPDIGILSAVFREDGTPDQRRSIIYPGYGYNSEMVDAIKMFDQAGVYAVSDLTLETRPCTGNSYDYNYYYSMLLSLSAAGPGIGGGDALLGGLLGGDAASAVEDGGGPDALSDSGTRVYFPETWLWELHIIPDTGVYSENLTLPDTITEWVGSAVCVHPQKGIGISAPASITSVKSFFIDLTLPPSVKVGEILPVKISVFNYYNTSLPVRITLVESSEYEILGSNSTEAAADQAAAGERSACVPSQDKETVVVRIRLAVPGSVAINVTAVVDTTYPAPCGSVADPDINDRISKPIAVDFEGFPRENTWTKLICSDDVNITTWYLEAPAAGIVNNSVRAWVIVSGDLMGPTLDNLGHLISMPYGCGEQNMITFTPNIYVLQYLQASNQANDEVTQRLLTYMRSGYQRELGYKRYDGSYSAFGNGDASGSTWLTAFVLRSYAQSAPYIDVDPDELTTTADFLTSLQLSTGCFQRVGTVIHKSMKGGVGASDTLGPLTAYVMAALLEAGVSPTAEAIVNATACIDAAMAADDDVYLLALAAYAYSLAGLSQAGAIINDLLTRATQTPEGLYWDMINPTGLYSDALSVETTSYVLLAMITANGPDPQGRDLQIVRWISSRRNGQGGFVSTQDTVLALQALALYGSSRSQQPQNLDVTVTGDGLSAVFQVTESNKLLSQRTDVDVVPNNVTADMAGSGCALVQAVVRYNVPDPDVSEVFTLSVSTWDYYSSSRCPAHNIRVCATYLLNDGESNMGIIEVNLVSGYVPQIEDLERIVADVTGAIKRYEVDNGKVQLYIDQFTDTEACVQFTAYQETEVEDVRPGTVRIYDYYEPDFFISETFTFDRMWC